MDKDINFFTQEDITHILNLLSRTDIKIAEINTVIKLLNKLNILINLCPISLLPSVKTKEDRQNETN